MAFAACFLWGSCSHKHSTTLTPRYATLAQHNIRSVAVTCLKLQITSRSLIATVEGFKEQKHRTPGRSKTPHFRTRVNN